MLARLFACVLAALIAAFAVASSSASAAMPKEFDWFAGHVNLTKRVSMLIIVKEENYIEPVISFMVPARKHCNGGMFGDAGVTAMAPNNLVKIHPDGSFAARGSSFHPDDALRIIAHWSIRGRFVTEKLVRGTIRVTHATFGRQEGPKVTSRCTVGTAKFQLRYESPPG